MKREINEYDVMMSVFYPCSMHTTYAPKHLPKNLMWLYGGSKTVAEAVCHAEVSIGIVFRYSERNLERW